MSNPRFCPHCRASLEVDARFCANCGESVATMRLHESEHPPQAAPPIYAQPVTPPPIYAQPVAPAPVYDQQSIMPNVSGVRTAIPIAERNWAMLCHLSALLVYLLPYAHILAPLVLWLMKREESAFVNDQGKEALNFNISMMIYLTIAALFSCIYIGIPFLIGLGLFYLIIIIVAAVQANSGTFYRYPITIRLIK